MNWLLLARLAIVNILCLVLFTLAAVNGWVTDVVTKDSSYISLVISVLFLFGLGVALKTGWYISRQLNGLNNVAKMAALGSVSPYQPTKGTYEAMSRRITARIATIGEISSWLMILGLIGTVVGFIVALMTVSPEEATDVAMLGKTIVKLMHGMDIALYTTLVGGLLFLWLRANFRIVANGATKLLSQLEQIKIANGL